MEYKHRANVTEIETSDTLFLSCKVSEKILDKNIWFLDSGCNNYMTGHYYTSATTTISLGDVHLVKASRKGVVPSFNKAR